MSLIAFDFDGTLSDSEMTVLLAERAGVAEEVAAITERAMNDEISYAESLYSRAELLEGLDDAAASETRFGGRIAHGTLVGGLISAALARFPGTIVYLSQDLEFLAPVDLESELTATCRIAEDLGDGRYRLTTMVDIDGQTCIDGEAVVLIEG